MLSRVLVFAGRTASVVLVVVFILEALWALVRGVSVLLVEHPLLFGIPFYCVVGSVIVLIISFIVFVIREMKREKSGLKDTLE